MGKRILGEFMRVKHLAYLTCAFALTGCSDDNWGEELSASSHALKTCTIVLGGGGKSQTITQSFNSNTGSYSLNTSSAWDFIRSTSGECRFTIYNDKNLSGRYVTLGSDLSTRIRAGEDGVRYKDDGGGATWRIRSVKIEPAATSNCFLNIGGGGVRMNYYPGNYEKVPAMDRISYFFGGNCDAKAWNESNYGNTGENNRYVALHTNALNVAQGESRNVYDPAFRVRSLMVRDWGNSNCSSETSLNRDYGRCLPSIQLSSSIYTSSSTLDKDKDGLNDQFENYLADAFTAIAINHSTEDGTRPYTQTDIDNHTSNSYPYYDFQGNPVIEPVVVFQVRKAGSTPNQIEISYMQIWKKDVYDSKICEGHHGDTQSDTFVLETPPSSHSLHGKFWWLKSTYPLENNASQASVNAVMASSNVNENPTGMPQDDPQFHIGCDEQCIAQQEISEREDASHMLPIQEQADDINDGWEWETISARIKDADKKEHANAAHQDENGAVSPLIMDFNGIISHNEMEWKQGDTHLRAPLFERVNSDPSNTNRHMLYFYTKGKHHAYIDSKFNDERDKGCKETIGGVTYYGINAHVDGRGDQHVPAYHRRLWNLRSPSTGGDRYQYNNVGSRDHFSGFVNKLTNFGFPNMRVWRDACFYSDETSSANKSFLCSNNTNKQCCLETNPGCSIPTNDAQWCCSKKYEENDCNAYSDVNNPPLYSNPNTIPAE